MPLTVGGGIRDFKDANGRFMAICYPVHTSAIICFLNLSNWLPKTELKN